MNRRRFVQRSLAAAIGASLPFSRGLGAILSRSMAVDADIDAITGDGASVTLKRAAVQELGESLRGNLLLPGHPAYDEARRVLNASIASIPALIVQPSGVGRRPQRCRFRARVEPARRGQVRRAQPLGQIDVRRRHDDRSSLMRGVRVDPAERIAYVSGGSLLGDMDNETMAFGLVTSAGTVSHTGVGGLTLGGGFGRVARRFGLSLDNVRAVDLVTADGQMRHASAEENPDLYWGVRGGGGNFGVVTIVRVRAAPDAARGHRRQHCVSVQRGAAAARFLR